MRRWFRSSGALAAILALALPAHVLTGQFSQDQIQVTSHNAIVDGPVLQPPPVAAPPGNGVIGGHVVNAKTKEPIKKAHVQLNGPTNLNSVTDSSGAFTFRALPPGGYVLSANHDEFYVPPSSGNAAQQITLTEDQQKTGLLIDLTPGATVDGRVLDEDELPVPRCIVVAMRSFNNQGRRMAMNSGSANTDEQGHYHLQNLQQGRYIIKPQCRATFPAAHGFMKRDDPMIPLEGYAPAVTGPGDSAAGTPVTAGAELSGVDFHVKRVPVFIVRGSVSGVDASLLPGVQVFLFSNDSTPGEEPNTPATYDPGRGQFTFRHVPAGSYEISATLSNAEHAAEGRQAIEVGKSQIAEFELKLTSGTAISGSLELDDPSQRFDNMQLSLQPLDYNYRGMVPIATLSADGTFEFKSVLPGHFTLNPLPLGYFKSVTLAGREVDPLDFEIAGGGAGPMRIRVGSKMAKIEVDISPKLAAGQSVSGVLITDGTKWQRPAGFAMSAPNGELVFPSVAPGKYRAFVLVTNNAWNLFNDPQTFKALDSHGVSVEVAEGDDKHISATVVSAEELQKVLDAEP